MKEKLVVCSYCCGELMGIHGIFHFEVVVFVGCVSYCGQKYGVVESVCWDLRNKSTDRPG